MVRKKKLIGYLKLLSSLLFMLLFVNLSTTCNAYTTYNGAPQLKVEEMEQIIAKISMDNLFSGDVVRTVTSTFNTWARTRRAVEEFYLQNIVFFRYNSTSQRWICWALGNGTYSDTLPYLYIGPSSLSNYLTTTSNNIFIRNFSDWVYDANNNKTSASVGTTTFYYIDIGNPSNYFTSTSGATVITNDKNGTRQNLTISTTGGGGAVPTLFIPNLVSFAQPYTVTSYTQDYGRDYYFLTNYLHLENESMFPTPTPTPSAEPTVEPTGGGGGSSVDLTETNELITETNELITETNTSINNINDNLTNTPSGDDFSTPSSGDLIDALNVPDMHQYSSVQATDNFWLALWNNLYTYLTIENYRFYTFSFLGNDLTLDNDDMIITNETVANIVQKICIVGYVVAEYKIIRKIVNLLSSGVISQIMNAYSKIDISDLF